MREKYQDNIHNGVIAVFQRKGLAEHELYNLNEGVRQLLKTELGSFFTEYLQDYRIKEMKSYFMLYLQNQLLTKGMVILRDKIRFYEVGIKIAGRNINNLRYADDTTLMAESEEELKSLLVRVKEESAKVGLKLNIKKTKIMASSQKLLDTLAETWDFFFSDVLPMLQAIFYPVQGKEPSVRQLALLHFRNIITLNIKLEDALSRSRARVPPSIIQMLLILQTNTFYLLFVLRKEADKIEDY
ncbi:Proline-rich protein 5 [Varanus komodoensis]|nr:Proline-rich protein 5 [Varanus komodoensis]